MNATRPYETAEARWRSWLILILVGTLLGRILFLCLFSNVLSFQTSGYDAYATNLMEGRGYTRFADRHADSDLPPLYPFFLAAVYGLLGRNAIAIASTQMALDLFTTLLLYLIGRRIWDKNVGLLAAMFYGLYPYLVFQNLTINDTGIFIFLLVTAIWLTYVTRDTGRWIYAAAAGAALGLGALTKTFIVALLPLLVLWWCRQIGWRNGLRLGLISGMTLLVVIAPWVARNVSVQGQWVFISTNGGSNFHQGNNACVVEYLNHHWDAQWVDCLEKQPEGLTEVEADHWHRRQGFNYLRDHPAQWPRLFGTKFLTLWSPSITPAAVPPDAHLENSAVLLYQTPGFQLARYLHLFYFGPLLALGIVGLIRSWRNKLPIAPLVFVFLVTTAVYVIFHPSTRYRSPADPFLFLFSACTVTQLHHQIRSSRRESAPA